MGRSKGSEHMRLVLKRLSCLTAKRKSYLSVFFCRLLPRVLGKSCIAVAHSARYDFSVLG